MLRLLLAIVFANLATSALAQTFDHTFVSAGATGNCSRSSPCGTLQAAYNVTNAGGVLTILNSGDYGALDIAKALTLRATGNDGGQTSITCVNCSAYWLGVDAGSSDVVNIEGIHIAGDGGLLYQSGAKVNVVNCVFENAIGAGEGGILVNNAAPVILNVSETALFNNGTGTGGGIIVKPRSGGSARVSLDRVTVNGNAFGIAVDGSTSTAGLNVTISDSVIAGNSQDGVVATTSAGGAPIGVLLTNVRSINNNYGVRSIGSNVTVRVNNSQIAGNVTGLAAVSGGALLTSGNNIVEANATNGAFSGTIAFK